MAPSGTLDPKPFVHTNLQFRGRRCICTLLWDRCKLPSGPNLASQHYMRAQKQKEPTQVHGVMH